MDDPVEVYFRRWLVLMKEASREMSLEQIQQLEEKMKKAIRVARFKLLHGKHRGE
jgi:hypothetical protein